MRGRRRHLANAAEETGVTSATEDIRRSKVVLAWACFGVSAYLMYGVKKVVPIVREGFALISSPFQWAFLVGTLSFFAYVEGYKGFQKGFSPRVVSRAWAVSEIRGDPPTAKEMFGKYGGAYLLSSLFLSAISFTLCYLLVRNGIDVAPFLAALGLPVGKAAQSASTAAIAYVLHKAASPIRFPPTVALTLTVVRAMGKDVEGVVPLPLWHKVLAPAFCIGYFHGTKKRVISSWCVTTIIFLVVVGVKRLSNPYRAIIDAGVVVGLMWGVVSILAIYAKSLMDGRPPAYDPSLPQNTRYASM